MRRHVLIFFVLGLSFLVYSSSEAAFRFILKNGSTIDNIASYEKRDGNLEFFWHGGQIALPQSDVVKIEEYTSTGETVEVPNRPIINAPAAPKRKVASAPNPEDQRRLAEIKARLAEIDSKEKALNDLKDEYNIVQERIENLYTIGRNAATAAGRTPLQAQQQYLQFLTPQQQQLVQLNFIRKGQLDTAVPAAEKEFEGLKTEREYLLKEKQEITLREGLRQQQEQQQQ